VSGFLPETGSASTVTVGEEFCRGADAILLAQSLDRVAIDIGDKERCEVTLHDLSIYTP
jgi:hypothetical protein